MNTGFVAQLLETLQFRLCRVLSSFIVQLPVSTSFLFPMALEMALDETGSRRFSADRTQATSCRSSA